MKASRRLAENDIITRGVTVKIQQMAVRVITKILLTMPRLKMRRVDCNPWLAKMCSTRLLKIKMFTTEHHTSHLYHHFLTKVICKLTEEVSLYISISLNGHLEKVQVWVGWFLVFKATFNNISVIWWRSVLLLEETGVPL